VSGRVELVEKFPAENPAVHVSKPAPPCPTKTNQPKKQNHINFTFCGSKAEFDKSLPGRLMGEEQIRQGLSFPSSLLDRSCQFSFMDYWLLMSKFCKF